MVALNEIQRLPELFELLRVLADRADSPARCLVLGSASPGLVRGVSESLAGRVGFVSAEPAGPGEPALPEGSSGTPGQGPGELSFT